MGSFYLYLPETAPNGLGTGRVTYITWKPETLVLHLTVIDQLSWFFELNINCFSCSLILTFLRRWSFLFEISIARVNLSLRHNTPSKVFCNGWYLGSYLSGNHDWSTTRKCLRIVRYVSWFVVSWVFDWPFNGFNNHAHSLCL